MNHAKAVCFSLYRGEAPIPVTVFKQKTWILLRGLELQVSIIGKSHRIISRIGNRCFTEFIAYLSGKESFQPLDYFLLNAGESHQKTYRDGDWFYRIWIDVIPHLFTGMQDFLSSLEPTGHSWETLDHGFEIGTEGFMGPFTGIAVDPGGVVFHTVHTYPEYQQSIISRTEISCPILER